MAFLSSSETSHICCFLFMLFRVKRVCSSIALALWNHSIMYIWCISMHFRMKYGSLELCLFFQAKYFIKFLSYIQYLGAYSWFTSTSVAQQFSITILTTLDRRRFEKMCSILSLEMGSWSCFNFWLRYRKILFAPSSHIQKSSFLHSILSEYWQTFC